jgi:DNA-binding protein HU-beta
MTRQQLIDAASAATGQSKNQVEATLDALLGEISKTLKAGSRVDLRGFGSFVIKEKSARQGRNPRTGETIQIPAKKAATFRPSKELEEELASNSGEAPPSD